ncbi:putative mitochondrial phospholipase c-like protein [Leptomonas pyrrhocoris]|uniref:Phosphoinositide phospholipase C n=1 Tax=Leptomonas pyrrhocoris TaxID=157538 RepID=A0A0N0VGP1_LEPPY|nr:putative mitochondrial phospholipase c-like protein [Leptomonas pyrrhocoris]KPA83384.1 putative mitochondrial phospholipase c-like protein [Leptomonas pyrrhocoris]|eukprot:XP_015661823.1 putative mitochondrial phospholipase c-like protein [Leptomonas pyrrhocoris]
MATRAIKETLPDPPTTEEELMAVNNLLFRLKAGSVELRRLTTTHVVHHKKFSLTEDGKALEYKPSNKTKRQTMLFTDLYEVTKIDQNNHVYKAAHLNKKTDVVVKMNTRTDRSWLIVFDDKASAKTWMQMVGMQRKGSHLNADAAVSSEDTLKGRIRATWERADVNHDGKVDLKEAKKLMVRMNVEISNPMLAELFKAHDVSGDGTLDLEEFTTLFVHLTSHKELRPLFKQYAADQDWMTRNEFDKFMAEQADESTDAVYNELQPNKKGSITYTSFVHYLLSPHRNPALDPEHLKGVVDDMQQPIKDYFINSSHNTYLSGDQFRSKSDIDMYKRALIAGCRCVELDCWDGKNGDPIVYHGYTRTSKIRFADVIETVRRHAFVTSPYPVILSLEVHTSVAQCNVMADHLQTILSDTLMMAKDVPNMTYTPDALKGKVLVKWKLPGKDVDDMETPRSDVESVEGSPVSSGKAETTVHADVPNLLTNCVTIGAFKTANWGKDAAPYNIQSYAETKVEAFAATARDNFTGQNSRMLARVYPKGSRIGSSNYNPTLAWSMGAQVVALNYQTWDNDMRLNDGMFSLNKGCGYVLKPKYLRDVASGTMPTACTIKVEVLCGTQIPKPSLREKGDIVDPYIKMTINGRQNTEVKTKVVRNNGLNPSWMENFVLHCESKEVDVFTVKIMDEDTTSANDPVCEMVIPVRALRSGYRAIPMKLCENGASLPGCAILCKFEIEDVKK